jgi:DNA polymerase-3 subunit delta'
MINFDNIVDQKLVKRILIGALEKNKLAHAYIFYGEEGIGKWALAWELSRVVNCQDEEIKPCGKCLSCKKISKLIHPDVRLIFPLPPIKAEGKKETEKEKEKEIQRYKDEKIKNPYSIVRYSKNVTISIELIREMQRQIQMKPYEGKKKVVIISDVENLSNDAANSLLKTLEEPPLDSLLILTTKNLDFLLTTLVSRCQLLRFSPLPQSLIEEELRQRLGISSEDASFIARLSQGSLGKAFSLAQDGRPFIYELGLELLGQTLKKEFTNILDFVERLTQGEDREKMIRLFIFLTSFLRDVYIFSDNKNKENLFYPFLYDEILKLSAVFNSKEQIEELILKAERIKGFLEGNANLKLALLGFCVKLREYVKAQSSENSKQKTVYC